MQIEKLFETIRKTYYPNWDAGGEWTVKLLPSRDPSLRFAQGRCDDEAKTILINEYQTACTDSEKVELLLIHEIAHAVTQPNHRIAWRNQMESVAEVAEGIGRKRLAELIRQQIREYASSL